MLRSETATAPVFTLLVMQTSSGICSSRSGASGPGPPPPGCHAQSAPPRSPVPPGWTPARPSRPHAPSDVTRHLSRIGTPRRTPAAGPPPSSPPIPNEIAPSPTYFAASRATSITWSGPNCRIASRFHQISTGELRCSCCLPNRPPDRIEIKSAPQNHSGGQRHLRIGDALRCQRIASCAA